MCLIKLRNFYRSVSEGSYNLILNELNHPHFKTATFSIITAVFLKSVLKFSNKKTSLACPSAYLAIRFLHTISSYLLEKQKELPENAMRRLIAIIKSEKAKYVDDNQVDIEKLCKPLGLRIDQFKSVWYGNPLPEDRNSIDNVILVRLNRFKKYFNDGHFIECEKILGDELSLLDSNCDKDNYQNTKLNKSA